MLPIDSDYFPHRKTVVKIWFSVDEINVNLGTGKEGRDREHHLNESSANQMSVRERDEIFTTMDI